MRKIILVLYIVTVFNLFAQASTTFGSGDIIHTLENSDIELKNLMIEVIYNFDERKWDISADYHFFNSNNMVTEMIYFDSHSFTMYISDKPTISDFKLIHNDVEKDIEYKKVIVENSFGEAFDETFTTDIVFKHGDNYINNSYSITGKIHAMPSVFTLPINLLSANKWKGDIDNFNMNIDFNSLVIFAEISPDFDIVGEKRINKFNHSDSQVLKEGSLIFQKNDFGPTKNFKISIYDPNFVKLDTWIGEISLYFTDYEDLSRDHYKDSLSKMSKADLRLLRNSIYAWHGQEFESSDLTDFFSNYAWYWPNENKEIILSELEKENIRIIQEYE